MISKLLQGDPYNSEYLAAMADAYARAGDDHGLQQFYTEKIAVFRVSSLPLDTRKAQIASLRRGLIPALTRMKDYAGSVDQYIELINNFPEDQALTTEAALYAERYQRQQQLLKFYAKTVSDSPRDFRWAMVLARIQTNLEDYPAAIATYGKAIGVRPDRSDLFTGRADLENRLMRFDDAAADYERLYQLNYKDPQWMEKVAETRARQGKINETVAALKLALIEGRPESAANYFEAAHRLESWAMLTEARSFAEQGTKTAGADLLANGELLNGAKTYVRIMTHLRQHEKAYDVMHGALSDASAELQIVEQEVAKRGIAGITDQQWRARLRQSRNLVVRHSSCPSPLFPSYIFALIRVIRGQLSPLIPTFACYRSMRNASSVLPFPFFSPPKKFALIRVIRGQHPRSFRHLRAHRSGRNATTLSGGRTNEAENGWLWTWYASAWTPPKFPALLPP